jgi:hypothetical protein
METAETAAATGSGSTMDDRTGLLFPLMLIAAVAVITFSAVGIATMLGWMPDAFSSAAPATRTAAAATEAGRESAARCAECGRILSVRPDGFRVRMDDGSIRGFTPPAQPSFSVGQKVRVTDQGVAAAG